MIYLDNNATTSIDPNIAWLMCELQLEGLANPASQHKLGRKSLRHLEDAKDLLLEALGAPNAGMQTSQVIFTSGGTEANNLAISGYAKLRPGLVIVAASEHASLLDPARNLGPERCRLLPVDTHGRCDLQQLEDWLRVDGSQIALVSVMLGNNETGVLQDLQHICQLCRRYSIPVHSDAVQAVGKIPIDVRSLGLSALTLNAHKLHGPVGIGALVLLPGEMVAPMLLGGGQQLGLRPGTEPVVAAVALAHTLHRSCLALSRGEYARVTELRDRFEAALLALGNIEIIAAQSERLPHVSNVAFLGWDRQALQMALDLAGVACSTGSACDSGSSRPSHVLSAMGLSPPIVNSSLRFSLSRMTTAKEVDQAIDIIATVLRKLR